MKKILSIIFLLTLGTVEAQTVLKFSDFTAETAPAGTDYLVGYRTPGVSGGNRRYSLSTLQTYFTSASQPLDADLTAIAALSGSNTAYYRVSSGVWAPIIFGSGLSFNTGTGTLTATGSGVGTVTNTGGSLTANALMLGAGTNDSKVLASLGTTTTVLHGNASGAPSFSAVSLTADVTNILPVANGGTGTTTPGLVAGTNVTVSGTWPNQTVNSSGGSGSGNDEIGFGADGGGSVVTTGLRAKRVMEYACTITGWGIVADQSGSIVMDIRKGTPSGGTVTTSTITGSATPALSSAQVATSTTLTGWTTSVAAGDVLELVVTGTPAMITVANLTLKITRP